MVITSYKSTCSSDGRIALVFQQHHKICMAKLLIKIQHKQNALSHSFCPKNPCSFSGWLFLYSSAYFIKYIPWLKRLMLIIGKRTLPIVILHFLSFKFVAAIAVQSYNLPSFCMAAYPNLYGKRGLWWLAYVIVGVSFPVIASILYEKIVKKCKNELRKAKA